MIDLNKSIAQAVKTGKVMYGSKSALKNAKTGKVRLIVAAGNSPPEFLKDLEYYCGLSKIPLIVYEGTSRDLGRVCGKPYTVSALAIRDPGDSDILEVTRGG
ncbi:MAG: 50S ribosomal protein L30e [Candidatus Bathyarchaeia archaeon]